MGINDYCHRIAKLIVVAHQWMEPHHHAVELKPLAGEQEWAMVADDCGKNLLTRIQAEVDYASTVVKLSPTRGLCGV